MPARSETAGWIADGGLDRIPVGGGHPLGRPSPGRRSCCSACRGDRVQGDDPSGLICWMACMMRVSGSLPRGRRSTGARLAGPSWSRKFRCSPPVGCRLVSQPSGWPRQDRDAPPLQASGWREVLDQLPQISAATLVAVMPPR